MESKSIRIGGRMRKLIANAIKGSGTYCGGEGYETFFCLVSRETILFVYLFKAVN